MNNLLWPLQLFILYPYAYSSDISSAYRRIKVDPSQVAYQLLVLFDFKKPDWHLHPIIVQQLGLPFGSTQAGCWLELAMEDVSEQTIT